MPVSRRELLVLSLVGLCAGAAYFVTTHLVTSPVEVMMPTWVPFLPVLTVPYLVQVVGSYVAAFFIQDRALRHAVFKAYFLAMAATFALWIVFPTTMRRPMAPAVWWDWPYALMARTDLPVHIFPAGHILMPVLLVWAFWHDRPRWLWWLVPAQVVSTVAIATVWQHRPVDILVGATLSAAAGLALGVGRRAQAVRS